MKWWAAPTPKLFVSAYWSNAWIGLTVNAIQDWLSGRQFETLAEFVRQLAYSFNFSAVSMTESVAPAIVIRVQPVMFEQPYRFALRGCCR